MVARRKAVTPEPAVVHIRTSERRAFHRCVQRWWWSSREGLTNKDPSHPLWFGSGIHEALAHYYQPGLKRGKDFVEVWEKWCDDGSGDGMYSPVGELGDRFIESRELGIIMLTGYAKRWAEIDKKWDFIQAEMPFQIRIPLDDGTEIEYDGTLDGVYRDKGDRNKIKLLENKTAKVISTKHLSLDTQAGSYWAIAYTLLRHKGILGVKDNIAGINYNFLRKAIPDDRPCTPEGYYTNQPTRVHYAASKELQYASDISEFKLGRMTVGALKELAEKHSIVVLGEISKTQPSPLFEREFIRRTPAERRSQIQHIKNDALWMNAAREGALPITKNPTMDCSWDCQFFEMCELQEQNSDWEAYRNQVYVIRDPYEDHRKSA